MQKPSPDNSVRKMSFQGTNGLRRGASPPPGDKRYYPLSRYLKQRFGEAVYRISVDGGFTCPNVDGTVARGGCIFCDNRSFSPARRQSRASIAEQIRRGRQAMQHRYGARRFIAYFQPATNTYAPIDKLRRLYDEALAQPDIIGLAVGTRPDCVPDPVLELLAEYAERTYVELELGLQTIHDPSLEWMNRGHDAAAFFDAVARASQFDFDLCVHVILGLPTESREQMLATIDAVAAIPVHGIKIHNLYIAKGTPLEGAFLEGRCDLLSRREYVELVCDCLERLPPEMVIHRLTGDAPPEYLVAPDWCLDKAGLLREIDEELARRHTRQGSRFSGKRTVTPPGKIPLPTPPRRVE